MKKLYSVLWLLVLIHLLPIIQGCPACRTQKLSVNATDVHYRLYSVSDEGNYQYEYPLDSKSFRIQVELFVPDSLLWVAWSPISTMASAQALDCDNFDVQIIQSIQDVEVGELLPDGTITSVTEQFYVEKDQLLYQTIDELLSQGGVRQTTLVSSWEPLLDSAEFILATTLSDSRVFKDTLKVSFR